MFKIVISTLNYEAEDGTTMKKRYPWAGILLAVMWITALACTVVNQTLAVAVIAYALLGTMMLVFRYAKIRPWPP